MNKTCNACPWMIKGQPDVDADTMNAAKSGEWFCCHANMGTCHGAKLFADKENKK